MTFSNPLVNIFRWNLTLLRTNLSTLFRQVCFRTFRDSKMKLYFIHLTSLILIWWSNIHSLHADTHRSCVPVRHLQFYLITMFEGYYKHQSYLLPYCSKYLKYIYHQTTTGYVLLWLSFRMTILFSFNALYFPLCHLIWLGCTEICCLTVMPDFLVPVTCVFYSDFQVLLITRFSELFYH